MNTQEIVRSTDLWKSVLELFQSDSYGILTKDNVNELSSELFAAAKIRIDEINQGDSWNESVRRLQDLIDSAYGEDNLTTNPKVGARGDAGANYYGMANGDEWVHPIQNIDGDKYGEVRGNDKILFSLNYNQESQFTIPKIAGNICRLIMPKYLRRVEIEDLNRNFWVIAQVISDLTNDILNPNSERLQIMAKILDEVTQLWENVAYLWAATGLVYKGVQTVSTWQQIPISPSCGDLLLAYKNYDDFGIDWIDSETRTGNVDVFQHLYSENHLRYYFDSFPDSNCIIVPFVRAGNYRENFFCQLIMPGILYHDCKTNTNQLYDFAYQGGEQENQNDLIYVDMKTQAIKRKTFDDEVKWLEIINFNAVSKSGNQEYKGEKYNTLTIVPKINLESLSDIQKITTKTLLFTLENNSCRILVKGTLYPLKQRLTILNGYRKGVIQLDFEIEEIPETNGYTLPYLGDNVSYYAS